MFLVEKNLFGILFTNDTIKMHALLTVYTCS